MVKNQKGFSLVELLAIIIITTTIIIPLLSSLVGNIEINHRFHDRRSAASVADGTINSINKLDFTDLNTLVDNATIAGNHYIELNQDNCTNLTSPIDEALCSQIFSTIWNNLSFDATTFRVFIYDYNIELQTELDQITGNLAIPQSARDEIANYAVIGTSPANLLRMTIWIQYEDDPVSDIVLSGLIFEDIPNFAN
jgi:type II secretory pathway pseudopilin PulG